MTPRVLIAGAFGQGNPGDQSVLHAFVSRLEGCDVAATVASPAATDPVAPDPAAEGAGYRPVPSHDRRAVARAVAAADLTIATATIFKTLHPSSGRSPLGLLANTVAMAAFARAIGRPLALIGVGAGELPGPAARVLARRAVAMAGHIDVRDEESAEELRRAGVTRDLPVGADVVWATLPPRAALLERGRPVAVIALSHLAGGSSLVTGLRATAAALHGAGFDVALHPWQEPQDVSMAAVTSAAGVPVQVWDPPADVAGAAGRYAGAGLVVGLRFHSLVAAGAAGVPFVAVAHETKLAALARRLGQEAVAPSAQPADMAAAALRAARGVPASAAAVDLERALAAAGLDGARQLAFARLARRSPASRARARLAEGGLPA